jgi:hypothetical protein
MIVRISGVGQYELDDDAVHKLNEMDARLTEAIHGKHEDEFHVQLRAITEFIEKNGKELSDETIVPSDVIVPANDISLEDAHQLFHDESLMSPVSA